jgi:uncharacterized 2Fe-2S/4Fe-4S cluster protein (DUF4445 family)
MDLCRVSFPRGKSIEVESGTLLLEAAVLAGVIIDAPCGGRGTCKKCKIKIAGKEVLACQTKVNSDLKVAVPEQSKPTISKVVKANEQNPHGAVIDLGTTTLAVSLLDLKSKKGIAFSSFNNPQTILGADVISRISYTLEKKAGLDRLNSLIIRTLEEMLTELLAVSGLSPKNLEKIVIAGNAPMQHILLKESVETLARTPFFPRIKKAYKGKAKALGFKNFADAKIFVFPNIAGFVGGDALADIIKSKIYKTSEISLLLDIGTNTEIVLGNSDRLLCASAAAGPALEGAKISMGMRAEPGAIDKVFVREGNLSFSTISNDLPVGICGSGLVDATAASLNLGLIDYTGRIKSGNKIKISKNIFLTQGDIRELQLAKGAIASGIEILIKEYGIRKDDIKTIFLAGAFGNYLNPKSALRIGLLPEISSAKIEPIEDAVLEGAKAILFSGEGKMLVAELSDKVRHIDLSSHPDFQKKFIKALNFPEGVNYEQGSLL